MLFSVPVEKYNKECINFTKSKKNIIMNGLFTKILYSDSDIIMNGLFLRFTLGIKNIHNKFYFILDEKNKNNQDMVTYMAQIEQDILSHYKVLFHRKALGTELLYLKNQLEKGIFKYIPYEENGPIVPSVYPATMECILKISGVWQNETHMGLNYKVVSVSL